MGVPKFFRYMSERYPCLSEFVKEYQIPVFDNLYLDMNGIIHMCSHPDDSNPHFRITEERLFADIFHYIEVLYRMIRPQKVFFMAIDGVAPRAKMNQQRGRRFRSAKDAERCEQEAKRKGEELPDTERFDSNCITPGTEFMAKLHEQLKYFIVHKISSDKLWKSCKIILSGHETPGEGEHKIMDYIRFIRSQPGYDPNTRHCLYGLDADLIMLGLCTHEPHFSLLREEVKFGKKSTKRNNVPEEIRFYLLHLSLMREYLELEFAALKDKLTKFDFNIENIIDDWVLMGFLVGNDFIPHLPNVHIANGALPILYKAYMEVLPTLDGYINEGGTLNLERFEKFMEKLGEIDIENFEEVKDDLLYMEAKTGRKMAAHTPVSTKTVDPKLAELIKEADDLCLTSSDEESFSDEDAFENYKKEYYRNKLEYHKVTPEVLRDQAEGYVRAIQWNLNYYYNGICSWSWYYPHHYAPYITDIKNFSNLKLEFELGNPFKPYEQLLGVLPSASKSLLPKCYHQLMTDENSIINKYYPEDFETDLNGKKQAWEAVVLIPFIDETLLLEAMKPCNQELNDEELKRNTPGPMLIYTYTDDDLGEYNSPNYFPLVKLNHAKCTKVFINDIRIEKEKLIKGAYPGVLLDVYYPGFPTMKHLKYKGQLQKAKIRVFEQPSRNESMMITIINNEILDDLIPVDLLGKHVFVEWPHLIEAKVVAISNSRQKYIYNEKEKNYHMDEKTGNLAHLFKCEIDGIKEQWMTRMGINFGEIKIIVHVKVLTGRRYIFTSNGRVILEKQFSNVISNFPLQGIVYDIKTHDDYNTTYKSIDELFKIGTICFTLTNPHYGAMGSILDSTETLKNERLKVSVTVSDEPDFIKAKQTERNTMQSYKNLHTAASQLGISNYVFSRITGSLFVLMPNILDGNMKSINIGLDLKFNKRNQETPGYTKKIDNTWYYSDKAIELVNDYLHLYPEVFIIFTKPNYDNDDDYSINEIFETDCEEKIKALQQWLKTIPTHNLERRTCNSQVLEKEVVEKIEQIVAEYNLKNVTKNITMQIKPQNLYKPEIQIGNLSPDSQVKTKLFDRIVNIRESFTVPLGLKGTVIGIHKSEYALTDDDIMYDVIFDENFIGGLSFTNTTNTITSCYRMPKYSFINLTYGKRIMEEKTGRPGELLSLAKTTQNFRGNNTSSGNSNQNNSRCQQQQQQQNSAFAMFNSNGNKPIVASYMNRQHLPNYIGNHPSRTYHTRNVQANFNYNTNNNSNSKVNQKLPGQDFMPNYCGGSGGGGGGKNYNEKATKNQDPNHRPKQSNENPDNSSSPAVNTEFLKKILKIDTSTSVNSNKNVKTENTPSTSTSIPFPISTSSNNNNNNSKIDEKNKSTNSEVSFDIFSKAVNSNATKKLLVYYQSNSLGCPRYTYFVSKPGFYAAQLLLPNNKYIMGKEAKTKEEASENVAQNALNMLTNIKTKEAPKTFPVPPKNWMQTPPQRSQQHQQQSQQQHHHQRQPRNMIIKNNNFKTTTTTIKAQNKDFISSKPTQQNNSVVSNNKVSTNNFVPLQAIIKKNRTVSGSSSTGNENIGSSSTVNENIGNNSTITANTNIKTTNKSINENKNGKKIEILSKSKNDENILQKAQNPTTQSNDSNKPRRQRKMRIAANFS